MGVEGKTKKQLETVSGWRRGGRELGSGFSAFGFAVSSSRGGTIGGGGWENLNLFSGLLTVMDGRRVNRGSGGGGRDDVAGEALDLHFGA